MFRAARHAVLLVALLPLGCGGAQRGVAEPDPVRDTDEGDGFEYHSGAVPAGPSGAPSSSSLDDDEDVEIDESGDADEESTAEPEGEAEAEADDGEASASEGEFEVVEGEFEIDEEE